MPNKKILIVAPAWIGDLIISAALIKALKNQMNDLIHCSNLFAFHHKHLKLVHFDVLRQYEFNQAKRKNSIAISKSPFEVNH